MIDVEAFGRRVLEIPARTKIVLAAAAGALLLVALCVALYAGSREANAVYGGQTFAPEQVTEIARVLATLDIPYTASKDTVYVPKDRLDEANRRLAAAGVPHDVDTSTNGFFASPQQLAQQDLTRKQDVIAQTIRSFAGIADATVLLSVPRDGVWATSASQPSSASVELAVQPGVNIPREEALAIASFVHGATGVAKDQISLVDTSGKDILGDDETATAQGATLTKRLQAYLDSTYGPGRTVANVTVAANPGPISENEQRRAPVSQQAITSQRLSEHYSGGKGKFAKSTSNDDRGSDFVERSTQTPAGSLQRLAVAVSYDPALDPDRRDIEAMARQIVSFDNARGDSIAVRPAPYLANAAPVNNVAAKGQPAPQLAGMVPFIPGVLIAFAIAAMLIVIARPLASTLNALAQRITHVQAIAEHQRIAGELAPEDLYERLRVEPPHVAASVLTGLPVQTAAATLEYFEPDERRAIVARLNRPTTTIARSMHAETPADGAVS